MPVSSNLLLDFEPEINTSAQTDNFWFVDNRESVANTTVVTYVLYSTPSDSAKKMIETLQSFKNLSFNWDSYGAPPPSAENIDRAISFVRQADKNLLPFHFTAPGPNGELILEFKEGRKEAAAYFNPDGTTELILNEGDNFILEGTVEKNYKDLLQFVNN